MDPQFLQILTEPSILLLEAAPTDEGAVLLRDFQGDVVLGLLQPLELSPCCEVFGDLHAIDPTFISMNSLGMSVIF